MTLFIQLFFLYFVCLSAQARSDSILCMPLKENCPNSGHRSSTAPAYPSKSSRVNLNPSAVPTEKGFGFEALAYKADIDFSLAQGTGRIGAAVSPSNNEETFFGPPGFEPNDELLRRKTFAEKYKSQKFSLATAVNLVNSGTGIKHFELNLGIIGKYNKLTGSTWPGGGLSGILGPFTFGYAYARDEFAMDVDDNIENRLKYRYGTETSSVGIYLGSLVADYSTMVVHLEDNSTFTTSLLTTSLMFRRWIFTYAMRSEDSPRPYYDSKTKTLITQRVKDDAFYGAQFAFSKNLLVGFFYNYYLLKEFSFGMTIFL